MRSKLLIIMSETVIFWSPWLQCIWILFTLISLVFSLTRLTPRQHKNAYETLVHIKSNTVQYTG